MKEQYEWYSWRWPKEADQILTLAVQEVGVGKWVPISKKFAELYLQKYKKECRRNGKQCQQRWCSKLDPALYSSLQVWPRQQQLQLIAIYQQVGPQWTKIPSMLTRLGFEPRSEESIKNRFNMLLTRTMRDLNTHIDWANRQTVVIQTYYKRQRRQEYQKACQIEKQLAKAKSNSNVQKKQQKKGTQAQSHNQKMFLSEKPNGQNNSGCQQEAVQLQQHLNENKRVTIDEKQKQSDLNEKCHIESNNHNNDKNQESSYKKAQTNKQNSQISVNPKMQPIVMGDQYKINSTQPKEQKINPSSQNIPIQQKKIEKPYYNPNSRPKLLKVIDRQVIMKLLLWQPETQESKLQINRQPFDSLRKKALKSFFSYMKDPSPFAKKQRLQLVQSIHGSTIKCRKINKRTLANINKEEFSLSEDEVERVVREQFLKIKNANKKYKAIFIKQKEQLMARISSFVERILARKYQDGQKLNRQAIIGESDQLTIKSKIEKKVKWFDEKKYSKQQGEKKNCQEKRKKKFIKRPRKIQRKKQQKNNQAKSYQNQLISNQNAIDEERQCIFESYEQSQKQAQNCQIYNEANDEQNYQKKQTPSSVKLIPQNRSRSQVYKDEVMPISILESVVKVQQDLQVGENNYQGQMHTFSQKFPEPQRKRPNEMKEGYNIGKMSKLLNCQQGSRQNNNSKSVFDSVQYLQMSIEGIAKSQKILREQYDKYQTRQFNFLNNSFLNNIRDIEESQYFDWKTPKLLSFQTAQKETQQEKLRNNKSNKNVNSQSNKSNSFKNEIVYQRDCAQPNLQQGSFNSLLTRLMDFQIPKKLVDSANNLTFPFKNFNDYSQNYQHRNSSQISKQQSFQKRVGNNSVRFSDRLKSSQEIQNAKFQQNGVERTGKLLRSNRLNQKVQMKPTQRGQTSEKYNIKDRQGQAVKELRRSSRR